MAQGLLPIPYIPHLESTGVLRMGLSPIQPTRWIETDSSIAAFHRHKRELQNRDFGAVFADAGGTDEAQDELAQMLDAHLIDDQPDCYRRVAGGIDCLAGDFSVPDASGAPLWRASLLVADDIALMQDCGGVYHLTAASLCSPSHWRLQDKIGRPMRDVHEPIPGIHDDLSPRIDRFFAHLQVDRPVQRLNWSLQWGDELYCPGHDRGNTGVLYYRAERQTLRRLPQSRAIVFTIRVYRCPVSELRALPDVLPSLLRSVDSASAPIAAYKGFHRYRAALAMICTQSAQADAAEVPNA